MTVLSKRKAVKAVQIIRTVGKSWHCWNNRYKNHRGLKFAIAHGTEDALIEALNAAKIPHSHGTFGVIIDVPLEFSLTMVPK